MKVDIVIFGGGVAGLWTLNALSNAGYSTILIEKDQLGHGQTILAQGQIHSGIKYALSGETFPLAGIKEIRDMPRRWRAHLNGKSLPDLSKVKVMTPFHYYWFSYNPHPPLLRPKAEKYLREKPRLVKIPRWVKAVDGYRINEQMVNTASLLHKLASPYRERIIYDRRPLIRKKKLGVSIITNKFCITPQICVLAAGEGNEYLAECFGIKEKIMQRRPLRQVLVYGNNLPPFYGFCVDGGKADFIITTHITQKGERLWNIGGNIATKGLSAKTVIAATRRKVKELFQGIDFSKCHFTTYTAIRAETSTAKGKLPSSISIARKGNIIYGWPSKLTLAPLFADKVLMMVKKLIMPHSDSITFHSPIKIAKTPWSSL